VKRAIDNVTQYLGRYRLREATPTNQTSITATYDADDLLAIDAYLKVEKISLKSDVN
jgi:hypothetical protein